jgi:hypothetical protein
MRKKNAVSRDMWVEIGDEAFVFAKSIRAKILKTK